jgi:hypothetical protein
MDIHGRRLRSCPRKTRIVMPRQRADATLRPRMDDDRVARRMEDVASVPKPMGGDRGENRGSASGFLASEGPLMARGSWLVVMSCRRCLLNGAGHTHGEVEVDVVGPKFSTHQIILQVCAHDHALHAGGRPLPVGVPCRRYRLCSRRGKSSGVVSGSSRSCPLIVPGPPATGQRDKHWLQAQSRP